MPEDTRRAVLEAALEKQMAPPEPAPEATPEPTPVAEAPVEAAPTPEKEPAPVDEKPRDDKGRFAPKQEQPELKLDAPKEEPKKPAMPQVGAPPPPPEPTVEMKAPPGWGPGEREHWTKLPPEVKQIIDRRYKETAVTLARANKSMEAWQRFQEAVRPYEPVMRMNGTTDPIQSAANLMQTAYALQTGSEQQKAAVAAQIIGQFGINPAMVADFLEKGTTTQAPQQFRDPRLDQLLQTLEQQKQIRTQQEQERFGSLLEEFGKTHEFFEDLRESMADIIETWDNQGKITPDNLTTMMGKAYDLAVQMDEETAKVARQRESAKQAAASQAAIEKAKAAASSVKGTPALAGNAPPKSRREALEQAWDQQQGRR